MKIVMRIFMLFLFFLPLAWAYGQDSATAKTKKGKLANGNTRILYGMASYYSSKFQGRKTANGEIFDHKKFTCACNVLPLGTWIKVTNLRNGKNVIVKTNDRLHPKMRRIVDLTKAAAQKMGFIKSGLTRVKVEVIGRKRPN